MPIAPGTPLPDATLYESTTFGAACPLSPQKVEVAASAKGKKIVLFGVPGAFTPTCSEKHLPGYVEALPALKALGVDEVWCVSVNDGFVMAAWGQASGATGKVRMLGDGSADFARKLGLELDLTAAGLGLRNQRFSMLVDDGIVRRVNVEQGAKFEVSDAKTMLQQLA